MSIQTFNSNEYVFAVNMDDLSKSSKNKLLSKYLSKCNYVNPPVSCTGCNTYLLMYSENIKAENILDVNNYIEYTLNNIFITYTVSSPDKNIMEIYLGGCEQDTYYMELMLYTLINDTSYTNILVAIKPELYSFENIVTYLVTNGFINSKLTTSTMLYNNLNSELITFTLDKYNFMIENDQIDIAYELKQKYLSRKRSCVFKIYIPLSVTDVLHNYVFKDIEYAGSLVIVSYKIVTENNVKYSQATLAFNIDSEVKGERLSVNPPVSLFNFHCHPKAAYITEKVNFNWPSNTDLYAITFLRELGNVIHFVITVEGIYSIQVTSDFGRYIDEMIANEYINFDECKQPLFDYIKQYLQQYNNLTISTSVDIITEVTNSINKLSINDIIKHKIQGACDWIQPDYNFTLYNMTYMSWEDIKKHKGFHATSNNLLIKNQQCPPSINTEINQTYNIIQ